MAQTDKSIYFTFFDDFFRLLLIVCQFLRVVFLGIFLSNIFTKLALWAISVSKLWCVHQLFLCLSVPSGKTHFLVDWRFLVKDCIANIGIPVDLLEYLLFQ